MRIEPTQPSRWVKPVHRVQPETVALMMQALGTHLTRVRLDPVPTEEPPRRVRAVGPVEAYNEQARGPQPRYIDEYC